MVADRTAWLPPDSVSDREFSCLVVEDNPDHGILLQQLIATAFPQATTLFANSYAEAVHDAHQTPCHVVLASTHLNNQLDSAALQDFLQVLAPLPIIVLTPSIDKQLQNSFIRWGAAACCAKQLSTLRELPELIDRLSRHHRAPLTAGLSISTTQSITALLSAIEQQTENLPKRLKSAQTVRTELSLLNKELALLRTVLGSLVPNQREDIPARGRKLPDK